MTEPLRTPGSGGVFLRLSYVVLIALLAVGFSFGLRLQQDVQAATVQTLQLTMLRDIDPAADALWESNGSSVTAERSTDIRPTTPAQWASLRRHVLTLIQGATTLTHPQLQVASPGVVTEGTGTPGVRTAAQIQEAIDADHTGFLVYVAELRRGAELALQAVDKQDSEALFEAGGIFYEACAGCHSRFWAAPDERRPSLPATINLAPKP